MPERRRSRKGCLIILVVVVLGVLGCITSVYAVVDVGCVQEASLWLEDYPGAELVREDHSWLRSFGIGSTTRVLYTPDDLETVNQWYRDRRLLHSEEGYQISGGFGIEEKWFLPAENGEGTLIFLTNECKEDLALW